MPRIAEDAIEHIKQTTDIVALIQSRGTKLTQKGQNWIGFCPFHNDCNTPNLVVTPSKGLFRCMSSDCGKAGNAIQFVQYHDGLSFRHAFELLDKGGKAAFEHSTSRPKKSHSIKLDCPLKANESDPHKLLDRVANYYHNRLTTTDGKAVVDYLNTRGLELSEAILTKFRIGLSDRTLGLRIPHSRTVKGKALRQQLQACGIYRATGREHLNGCLTIPITNIAGETVQIYGRRIGKVNSKSDRHLYLAKKQEGIFNAEIFRPGHIANDRQGVQALPREIILCESILDALTFYHHGMENVTCTYGTSNFSQELIEAIKSAKIESIKLAFDADNSGEKATSKVSEALQKLGIQVHQIKFPWGTDANEYAKNQGKNALQQAVRNAPIIEFKSQEALPLTKAREPSLEASRAPSSLAASLAAEAVDYVAPLAAKEENILTEIQTGEASNNQLETADFKLTTCGDFHKLQLENRSYRIGGLHKNNTLEVLRITLRITHEGLMHVDSLDLYRDGERRKYIDRASEETLLSKDLIKRDIGKLLLALEQSQEDRLNAPAEETETKELSSEQQTEALKLLQSKDLLTKITEAYDKAGIVGEKTNKLAAYLACVSRKLSKPLAVIIK